MKRMRSAALAGLCLALLAVAGCRAQTPTPGPTHAPGPTTTSPATPDSGGPMVPDDEQGGSVAPNSQSTPEAAQAYLACLTQAGVGAAIVDETRVVLVADPQAGDASSSEEISQAEQQCREQVPDYHEPDFNER